jgi:hypothetical protein
MTTRHNTRAAVMVLCLFSWHSSPALAHHGEASVHVEQGAKKRAAQKKKLGKPVAAKAAPGPTQEPAPRTPKP